MCAEVQCTVCVTVDMAQSVDGESDNLTEAYVKLLQSTDICLLCPRACLLHIQKCYLLIYGCLYRCGLLVSLQMSCGCSLLETKIDLSLLGYRIS